MIHVLWDAADIWGLLATWGVNGLGVPFRVVTGSDVAGGILAREHPHIFLAPGGFSRHKAAALGPEGQEAVRAYVRNGGRYLGFCGGSGLALTGDAGLGICPWRRAGYAHRIQHYMSGHFGVAVHQGAMTPEGLSASPSLPVWWPARFAPVENASPPVSVLATYDVPGHDFWFADIPVSTLPEGVFNDWETRYGVSSSPSLLYGDACVIHGEYGKGDYLLTYSHLETPESPDANLWFAHAVSSCGGTVARTLVPRWDLTSCDPAWEDPGLLAMWQSLKDVTEAGIAAGLFFVRSSWLLGWRMGIPGAVVNTVRAQLHAIITRPPSPEALALWQECRGDLVPAFQTFASRAVRYLLAERLAMALAKDLPETLMPERLFAERSEIFGASGMAAHAGGLLGAMLPTLDALALRQVRSGC